MLANNIGRDVLAITAVHRVTWLVNLPQGQPRFTGAVWGEGLSTDLWTAQEIAWIFHAPTHVNLLHPLQRRTRREYRQYLPGC
jgi:hypothetical protein